MIEDIKLAYLDFERIYLQRPKSITMSRNTQKMLGIACQNDIMTNSVHCTTIYGMEIQENDQLPDNTFVIGGIVITSSL